MKCKDNYTMCGSDHVYLHHGDACVTHIAWSTNGLMLHQNEDLWVEMLTNEGSKVQLAALRPLVVWLA